MTVTTSRGKAFPSLARGWMALAAGLLAGSLPAPAAADHPYWDIVESPASCKTRFDGFVVYGPNSFKYYCVTYVNPTPPACSKSSGAIWSKDAVLVDGTTGAVGGEPKANMCPWAMISEYELDLLKRKASAPPPSAPADPAPSPPPAGRASEPASSPRPQSPPPTAPRAPAREEADARPAPPPARERAAPQPAERPADEAPRPRLINPAKPPAMIARARKMPVSQGCVAVLRSYKVSSSCDFVSGVPMYANDIRIPPGQADECPSPVDYEYDDPQDGRTVRDSATQRKRIIHTCGSPIGALRVR